MSPRGIDLNCDLGEEPREWARDLALLELATSANVACGGHAGDEASMRAAIRAAARLGVAVGGHPSYPDRERFGRLELEMEISALIDSIAMQIAALSEIAALEGVALTHVKPHGALYNRAARDLDVAAAIAEAVARVDRALVLVGLAASPALDLWSALGFATAGEAFADRGYAADGTLVPRNEPGALHTDPEVAAAQAVRLASTGLRTNLAGAERLALPDTICVHSDTPGSPAILAAVRSALAEAGFTIAPLSRG